MLMLFVTGSLMFGICWAIFEHDLQGAFGVSTYIVSFVRLLVGTLQTSMGWKYLKEEIQCNILIRPLLRDANSDKPMLKAVV